MHNLHLQIYIQNIYLRMHIIMLNFELVITLLDFLASKINLDNLELLKSTKLHGSAV